MSFREEIPEPAPDSGEALVRVRLAGICGTDLQLCRGYYPFRGVPGHEFVGEIVASEGGQRSGERVVGEINAGCGACARCLAGSSNHCPDRTVLGIRGRNGAFAEFLCLPLANLHSVPPSVSDVQAVFTEPLAAALQIQRQVEVSSSDRVLVVGAGRLGQLIARTMALAKCRLRAVARHESQRTALRGICEIVKVAETSPGWADIAIEATGSPGGLAIARQAVRPGGTVVLKSTYKGRASVDFSALVVDEIRIVGSRCGPFAPALRLLERGAVETASLVDQILPLESGLEAFGLSRRPGALKTLLEP